MTGALFFVSADGLAGRFDYAADPDLDAVTAGYAQRGKRVEIVGLDVAGAELHGRLSGELAPRRSRPARTVVTPTRRGRRRSS